MITHDYDGLPPAQIARIDRLQLARYRKPLTEAERAQRFLRRGLIVLGIIWILGLVVMFYTIKPHHGHAVYLPGGIEVTP